MQTRLVRMLLALSVALAVPLARAQDYVSRVNALYANISSAKRSDTILIPALMAMEAPPDGVRDIQRARLIVPGMQGWKEAVEWAEKPPQRAAIEALMKATEPQSSGAPMAWGQPYGVAAVTPAIVKAKMYTELGDPPLLAAAQFLYLPKLTDLCILANIEATRLQAEGKVFDAVKLMGRVVILGRQLADRQFFREARWGLDTMVRSLERIRDIAYVDFRGKRLLTRDQIAAIINALDEKGEARTDRILFPIGDLIGAEQTVAIVTTPKGGINEKTFPTTMATLTSSEQPLRLFSEAAEWKSAGAGHADRAATIEEIRKTSEDYTQRWPLDWFHNLNALEFERNKLDKATFAVIEATVPDMSKLFNLRQAVRTEMVGTRAALAIVGTYYALGAFPPRLSSVAPEWMTRLDIDPFNPELARGNRPPLEYFVPIRDQVVDPNVTPPPHEINIVTENGDNFSVKLKNDTAVIYSWGADNRKGWAKRVQNTVEIAPDVDYLIWPSELSLYRQYLSEIGELK
ncbi:MAG: hypothetical protein KF691_05180 [Phycisphaeraceae bacterium]|nr:hypothetical protein [Phycisphaeraceae bacterium]